MDCRHFHREWLQQNNDQNTELMDISSISSMKNDGSSRAHWFFVCLWQYMARKVFLGFRIRLTISHIAVSKSRFPGALNSEPSTGGNVLSCIFSLQARSPRPSLWPALEVGSTDMCILKGWNQLCSYIEMAMLCFMYYVS